MTENEWSECDDPRRMLRFLGDKPRTWKRFSYACCNRVRHLLIDSQGVTGLEILRRAPEEAVSPDELRPIALEIERAIATIVREINVELMGEVEFERQIRMARTGPDPFEACAATDPRFNALRAVSQGLHVTSSVDSGVSLEVDPAYAGLMTQFVAEAIARSSDDVDSARLRERKEQASLIRCLFGGSSGKVPVHDEWRTETVMGLANRIDMEDLFDHLPILADALLDAGCNDESILAHCHADGPHARGCWVVDLLSGRE